MLQSLALTEQHSDVVESAHTIIIFKTERILKKYKYLNSSYTCLSTEFMRRLTNGELYSNPTAHLSQLS